MIQIEIDEAEAFDRLAIHQIKSQNFKSPTLKEYFKNEYDKLKVSLNWQITSEIVNRVITSSFFQDLIEINEEIFEAVELAKENKVTAKKVDDLNVERYNIKKKLQETFFSHTIRDHKT